MDEIIYITHELMGEDVRYYGVSIKNNLKSKLSDFIEINNMSVEKWASGRKMLRVEGTCSFIWI